MSDALGCLIEDLCTTPSQRRRFSSSSSSSKKTKEGMTDATRSLQRVASQVSTPLAKFLQTLEHVQTHLEELSSKKSTIRRGSNKLDRSMSLEESVAAVLINEGPLLTSSERETVWNIAKQVAGRPGYYDIGGGNLLCQWAAVLYQQRFNVSIEVQTTKLNYPFKCPLTTQCQLSKNNPMIDLPEYQRGQHRIVVVGLPSSGKSALCGRLIQACGQCSPLALSKAQSAAKRVMPEAVSKTAGAVWLADRDVLERYACTTLYSKEIPLYHTSIGSFMILDTPPFVGCEHRNNDLLHAPKLETARRSALDALTLCDPKLIVVCVAADMDWEDTMESRYFEDLVRQVRATMLPQKSRLVFVVTRMDNVEWSQDRFDATSRRIHALVGASKAQIIPSSAVKPAPGIVFPISKLTGVSWARNRNLDNVSLLSIAQETFSEMPTTDITGVGKAIIFKNVQKGRETNIVLVKVLQGCIGTGDETCLAPYGVESIQWCGHPCSVAYQGQRVGLKLRKLDDCYHEIFLYKGDVITFTRATGTIKTTNQPKEPQTSSVELSLNIDSQIISAGLVPKNGAKKQRSVVAYPNQVSLCISNISIVGKLGTSSVLAKTELENETAKRFFLGHRFVLYLGHGSKKMCGFGVVTRVSGIGVAGESLGQERLYSNWLSRTLIPSPEHCERPAEFTIPPLTRPHRLSRRNISEVSALSMSLGSLGGIDEDKLASGPATSINEAIRQTDAAVKAMMKLRDELEKLKAVEEDRNEGGITHSCYMCMRQCPMSPQANLVPICEACTSLNEAKRSSNLGLDFLGDSEESVTFVITGARIKIGYATVRRILLDDSIATKKKTLVLTTRFPYLLAEKLFQDFPDEVKEASVHIYGSDFRSVPSVLSLGKHFAVFYPKVFALINNAAQTVRRPPAFYASNVERELKLAQNPGGLARMVKVVGSSPFEVPSVSPVPSGALIQNLQINNKASGKIVRSFQECESIPLVASAMMTQCQVLEGDFCDFEAGDKVFLLSKDGVDPSTGENVCDLRTNISWRKSLLPNPKQTEETVEPVEFLEVLLVNTLAPYTLLKSLVDSLRAATGNVINVSSREGVFARVKFSEHPHTNSAKAGLNMLTRTTSYELKKINVMICSVDTGWVSKYYSKSGFYPDGTPKGMIPPLTADDAAARILDPIAQRLKDGGRLGTTGCYYRDFKATSFL